MNKAILQGRVGADPEIRQVGETKVANIRLATSRKYKDKQGNPKEETQWHSLDLWAHLADLAEKHITKGCKVLVDGEIQYRQHNEKWYTSIRVNRVEDIQWPKKEGQSQAVPPKDQPTSHQEGPDDLPF